MGNVIVRAIEHSSAAERPRIEHSWQGRGLRNAHSANLVFVSASVPIHYFIFFVCKAVVDQWIEVKIHLGEMIKVSTHLGPTSTLD